ncbi:MFS multidrug transporter-like protein [Saccharata proteae CBS 121410]|uniref:MFS multidrug transporter-like protein n=1 Tax=Saccharata proteae CBS 121410 TaxID=1314787 RepID=A0A9P4I1U6_9PEZI|nr:MFS multidrug transporter-like protein [Saccharata proteae CBS 121410]
MSGGTKVTLSVDGTLQGHPLRHVGLAVDRAMQRHGALADSDPDIVVFPPEDPEYPRNWPRWRKWGIIGPIILIDLSVSWGASGFSPASANFAKVMGVSSEVATLGLSLYVLGLALGPMTLEQYYGRCPLYIIPYGIYLCFLLGTALAPNLGGFLVLRILSGYFSSVTIANFGGTIADLYHSHDTGPAMSLFLWAATVGSPTGYLLMSFVAQNYIWNDVFWALLGISGGFWLIMVVALYICGETRHSVLLARRAAVQRKRTQNANISVPDDMRKRGSKELFRVALTRPFRFLGTEAIVIFAAIYNGYLYGLSFLFNGAFSLVFGPEGHGFDIIGVGLCFLGITVGITLGPLTNLWQERYYQRRVAAAGGKNIPEARVQLAKVAAVVFPLSLFWFAWSTFSFVHWIVPVIASAFWGWSFYTLILMTYTYTEDSYKVYSASALAGIGLVRNTAGAGFPLFGRQLFVNEGYQWAGTILAFLAVVLVPIPFILASYGREIRKRSPWAREHMDDLDDEAGDEGNDNRETWSILKRTLP